MLAAVETVSMATPVNSSHVTFANTSFITLNTTETRHVLLW